jgi:hypothetical protein
LIVEGYVKPKRGYYLRSDEKYLPLSQNKVISYSIDASQTGEIRITNTDTVLIDISGLALPQLEGRVPSGTVMRPGQSVIVTAKRVPRGEVHDKNLHVAVELLSQE